MLTHAIVIFPFPSHPDFPPLRIHLLLRNAPKSPYEKGYPRPWPGEGLDDAAHSHSCAVKAARDAKNRDHCYHFCRAVSFWLFFLVLCTLITSFVVSRFSAQQLSVFLTRKTPRSAPTLAPPSQSMFHY